MQHCSYHTIGTLAYSKKHYKYRTYVQISSYSWIVSIDRLTKWPFPLTGWSLHWWQDYRCQWQSEHYHWHDGHCTDDRTIVANDRVNITTDRMVTALMTGLSLPMTEWPLPLAWWSLHWWQDYRCQWQSDHYHWHDGHCIDDRVTITANRMVDATMIEW